MATRWPLVPMRAAAIGEDQLSTRVLGVKEKHVRVGERVKAETWKAETLWPQLFVLCPLFSSLGSGPRCILPTSIILEVLRGRPMRPDIPYSM